MCVCWIQCYCLNILCSVAIVRGIRGSEVLRRLAAPLTPVVDVRRSSEDRREREVQTRCLCCLPMRNPVNRRTCKQTKKKKKKTRTKQNLETQIWGAGAVERWQLSRLCGEVETREGEREEETKKKRRSSNFNTFVLKRQELFFFFLMFWWAAGSGRGALEFCRSA